MHEPTARPSAALHNGPRQRSALLEWFYHGLEESPSHHHAHTAPWWQVMCLTGVDYFSTLGYQPGIAFLAAGFLSPIATFVLVIVTLCGALPAYARVAELSPHGQGSIAVLEEKLPRWRGKALVLCLLGFAATAFVITITVSAADATAHIVENPFARDLAPHPIAVTIGLIAALGAVFVRGLREAVWVAVAIVAVYLVLNAIVVGNGLLHIASHPEKYYYWRAGVFARVPSWAGAFAAAMLIFPRLALGLSGFETGVAVMPLVRGEGKTDEERLANRIRNTKKMLAAAAIIMSLMLMGSSIVTTLLIPPAAFEEGGEANGRALAYIAHRDFGDLFGTAYDLATITILWFAGASAMAGLLTLIPRYLPRYGMAPEWARASRPLVLIITAIAFLVTVIFKADVEAQAGAYATGVLVLMMSVAFAAALSTPRWRLPFGIVFAVFLYTTLITIVEQPEGLTIALWFIAAMVATSLVSRVMRSTELRALEVRYDAAAERLIDSVKGESLRIIANRPDSGLPEEYDGKLKEAREAHHLPPDARVVFLEIHPGDVSEFANVLHVRARPVAGHTVLSTSSPAIPNAIAAVLMDLRQRTGATPHAYFGWTEGNPITYLLKFLAFGEGDTAPVAREVLRKAEPVPELRPRIHVG